MAPDLRQRCIVLRAYPVGLPRESDFECVEQPVRALDADEVCVEIHYLSIDPATRLRMNLSARQPPPMPLGSVVIGRGIGVVTATRHAAFHPGDVVVGELGWQQWAVMHGSQLRNAHVAPEVMQTALGVLGPSGITAWCLVHEAAKIRQRETVVVAAAAGAVGSVALQLARLAGAHTIAVVGSAAQASFVELLGADAVVNYTSPALESDLRAAAPAGVDVFLDSVGGELHNNVVEQLAVHARVIAFGYISAYNLDVAKKAEYGRIYRIIHQRAELRGFLVADYGAHFANALDELTGHLAARRIQNHECCVPGLDKAPRVFAALFTSDPIGKQLVRVRLA